MHLLCNSFLVCLTNGKNNHNELKINLLQYFPIFRKMLCRRVSYFIQRLGAQRFNAE